MTVIFRRQERSNMKKINLDEWPRPTLEEQEKYRRIKARAEKVYKAVNSNKYKGT